MTKLEVRDLRAWYGSTQALFDVSLAVSAGETVALVGANGAGKSTTLKALAGLVRTAGSIRLDGEEINGMPPWRRATRHDIVLVHEDRGLFSRLSVRENILIGTSKAQRRRLPEALELFPRLAGRLDANSTLLSGGEQQMVALARAVVCGPRLLLLDEPALGLAPVVAAEVYEVIGRMRSDGMAIVLAEPSLQRATDFAGSLTRLEVGRTVGDAQMGEPSAA